MADGKERLDSVLVKQGIASGREKAKELIQGGAVTVNGVTVTKPSFAVRDGDTVACTAPPPRYVGRGGYKLEKAIAIAAVPLSKAVAMDVGASTGGFTDCMLQNGAQTVYAVDVGHGQLHPTLREDERVHNLEGTDIRDTDTLSGVIPPHGITVCSVDVSFISLAAVLPSLPPFLADGATVVCLIKPQFEAGKAAIGKNGIVKDKKEHIRVLRESGALFASLSLGLQQLTHSPITGGEGNIEYLAVLTYQRPPATHLPTADAVVATAFETLKT